MTKKYDAAVIGSGQGGNPLAHRLADLGWKVALIEKKHLGGTCINTGCTPTKTMVASAQIAHYARQAARWGVRTGPVSVDLKAIVERKRQMVESFRSGQEKAVAARKTLELFRETARFTGPHTLSVGSVELEAERIFINAGTRPSIPEVPGLANVPYLTNESLMELTELPERLAVLGGGYIGLEFGQMFHRFGSEVTVIHRGGQLLPREDEDIARELENALTAEGIRIRLNTSPSRVEASPKGVRVHLPSGESEEFSHLLVAAGRTPNTGLLDLPKAGIEMDRNGYVQVNERLETSAPGVWAIGDIKGGPAFTHISYNDYQIVWANLIEKKNESTGGRLVPYCVFTDPQLGGAGLTEREARQRGYALKTGKIPMSRVARALERDETSGMMKIVVDASNDRILGASILGAEGGELIQILAVLMREKLPYTVLKGAVYIHPTLAEGFFALMDSVQPVDS